MRLEHNGNILVITGPTASGKTEVALTLARTDPRIEIVNADASLIYRGFDIGMAKPPLAILNEIPHHLVQHSEHHRSRRIVQRSGI